MYVLRQRGAILVRHATRRLPVLQKLQAGLDVNVCRIEIRSSLIRIESIGRLVVARLILKTVNTCYTSLRLFEFLLPECQGRTRLRIC